MFNHTLPTPLNNLGAPLSPESEARWARKPAKTCVIYVHGYGGHAVKTWGDFPDLAMERPEFQQVDLVFLGYESRSRPAVYNVGVLYQAVCLLAEEASKVTRRVGGPERANDFAYESIILVGHSLGGALVRDVAMSAREMRKGWADKMTLALFAPAHVGANVIELIELSLGFLKYLGPMQAFMRVKSPVLNDLRRGSDYLNELRKKAERIGTHCTTQAKLVVHASNDWIVFRDVFFQDPPLTPYDQHDHVSCCKPIRALFQDPVTHLIGLLP
ncbi:hypothetical protein NKH94_14855 [Mesorhizobium australicum]|uniref:hypothetical protein n=1 Tax=Mesorhizobium australicum TaxID=536018 RepID=UPI003336B87A